MIRRLIRKSDWVTLPILVVVSIYFGGFAGGAIFACAFLLLFEKISDLWIERYKRKHGRKTNFAETGREGTVMRSTEIYRRIKALADGDSNDEEIDGLTEIIRELQEERAQMGVRIVFNPEAFETAMRLFDQLEKYRVELTLKSGETIDVYLHGMNDDRDHLTFRDYETRETAPLQSVLWEEVESIYVY